MTAVFRPRRSMLYLPGSNARALEKARSLGADGYIFDLEDAVAPSAKPDARTLVVAALAQGGYGRSERLVRINALDTAWGRADVAAVSGSGADGIVIPKVSSAQDVLDVVSLLRQFAAPATLKIWCMVETARGVLSADAIAGASPLMAGLIMGTSDLAKDLFCAHTPMRLPLLASLGLCVLAARANGIAILDGVHLDLADDEGFAAVCVQGREFGVDGKTLIHPKTIAKANEVFRPSEQEIGYARSVLTAHAGAERNGMGVVLVDGKLVENLHVDMARRLLAIADELAGHS